MTLAVPCSDDPGGGLPFNYRISRKDSTVIDMEFINSHLTHITRMWQGRAGTTGRMLLVANLLFAWLATPGKRVVAVLPPPPQHCRARSLPDIKGSLLNVSHLSPSHIPYCH
jgi:hypothetical protein